MPTEATYPEPLCQDCQQPCERFQEVRPARIVPEIELWCYCPICNIETFHPIPSIFWQQP